MTMPPDAHTLTGVYVLNALSVADRERFERHLVECASCAGEVAELSEAAARLGSTVATQPPAQLRAQVMAAVAGIRQLPPPVSPYSPPAVHSAFGRTRWLRAAAVTAAAAAVIATVVFGYQSTVANQELSRQVSALQQSNDEYRTLADLLATRDARVVTRATDTGATMSAVVSPSRGVALLIPREMPAPPPQHTYQAWVISAAVAHSAGLFTTADPARPLLARGITPGDQIGVTIEPQGGSPQPTTAPIMVIPL